MRFLSMSDEAVSDFLNPNTSLVVSTDDLLTIWKALKAPDLVLAVGCHTVYKDVVLFWAVNPDSNNADEWVECHLKTEAVLMAYPELTPGWRYGYFFCENRTTGRRGVFISDPDLTKDRVRQKLEKLARG